MGQCKLIDGFLVIGIFISVLLLSGCETEQVSNNNDAMVGYAREHAKKQAEFLNQEQLEKATLIESKVVTDGTTQPLDKQ
ncbi:hypothetical protein [Acinetobacter populi]|uniref:Lipoprotein n=1 Tax=Acinetobacter populi TaxID=1582270 RepID=A0A1Z9Z1H6_9GAMM|nr:hypothetical protein [Acinetobacter populi]OUY08305.1 hypothetical protein CAP51_01395 [Acinetobacter populi]